MPDTCSCSPGACHGGHTINMGMPVTTTPPTPQADECRCLGHMADATLTDEQVRRLTNYVHPDEATDYVRGWIHSMAAELLAQRARVTELETERGQLHTDRMKADQRTIDAEARVTELEAAQREPIGYAVISTAGQDDYLDLASDLLHQQADTAHGELIMARAGSPSVPWRVVELREVGES